MIQVEDRMHKPRLHLACLFLSTLFFAFTGDSKAAAPSWLEISYLLQAPEAENPRQLEANQNWQRTSSDNLSFGWHAAAVWVRLHFSACPMPTKNLYLEINYPPLSTLQFWQGSYSIQTGQDRPFSSRAIPASSYIFPIRCDPLSPAYLKVYSTSSLQIPLRIFDEQSLVSFREKRTALYSLYIGGMISLILYNLFLMVSTRSLSYLYYVLYLTSILVFLSTQFGISFQFIWPESPLFNDYLLASSLAGTLLFGLLFCAGFLRIQRSIPEFRWVYWLLLAGVGLCCLGILLSPSRRFLTFLAPFVTLFVVIAAITALRRGVEEARLFLGG